MGAPARPQSSDDDGTRAGDAPRIPTVLGEHPAPGPIGFARVFRPHLPKVLVGLVWLGLTNAFALAAPRLINEGIAAVEGTRKGASILAPFGLPDPGVLALVLALVITAAASAVVRVLSRIVLFNVGRDIERALRTTLFSHLATMSPSYYRKNTTGDLMSRLTNDLTNVRLMAGFALLNALNAIFIFAGTLPLLFAIDARVAFWSLLPFPLVILVSQALSGTMFRRTRENQAELGRLTAAVQENLSGQSVVRAFAREDGEERRFAEKNERLFQSALRLAHVRVVMFPLMGLMSSLAIAVALLVAGQEVVAGRLDVGDVVEFNTRLFMLSWPTVALGFILSVYQRGKASLTRINEVLAARPEIVDGPFTGPVQGRVEARGLTVSYEGQKRPALDGVTFEVPAGGVLGVVGRNASGKTTLVRSLARLSAVPRGQLFYDGVDVNEWHLVALHQGVAVVPDDGFLFSATLRENLAFACPDASDDEIAAAVDLADLGRDLAAFPEGLRTIVGERGITLSGGQRQRVALARAILARPRVLILDDSLSAVDAETETRIVASLRGGFAGLPGRPGAGERAPTLVVVSHRLSAVRDADVILVLDEGRVVERGRHADLLAQGGIYADLWGREQLLKALDSDAQGAA